MITTSKAEPTHKKPPVAPIGIIGGGFGALIVYGVLRFRGVSASDILIFSPDTSPEKSWISMVRPIGQRNMRSESTAHFFPTDSPGLATVEAVKTWSLKPIILSWFDKYHPTVEFMVEHGLRVARLTGFFASIVKTKIGRVERIENGYSLYNETGDIVGVVRHLILAVGHGAVRSPEPFKLYRKNNPSDTRVLLPFEDKTYSHGETVAVVGDGLTSATEWVRILENGGKIIAVSLNGFVFGQQLNTPRMYFSKLGIAPWRTKGMHEKVADLRKATRGTIPFHIGWKKLFADAQNEGRLTLIQGNLSSVSASADGRIECAIDLADGSGMKTISVDKAVATTGFMPTITNPLLAQLITDYSLPTVEDCYLDIDTNFSIPTLSEPESKCFVIGQAAAWQIPCADSLGGMKITARTIAKDLLGPDSMRVSDMVQKLRFWFRLITGKTVI